jgi:hypothetical protein
MTPQMKWDEIKNIGIRILYVVISLIAMSIMFIFWEDVGAIIIFALFCIGLIIGFIMLFKYALRKLGTKGIGIVLILIGLCLPLVSFLLFLGSTSYGRYYRGGMILRHTLIEFQEGWYILAFGVVLVFIGIGFITLSGKEKR